MKEFLKKYLLPKPMTKQIFVQNIAMCVVLLCGTALGFMAGFKYGTGGSIDVLFKASQPAYVPEVVLSTLNDATTALNAQPPQTYREGYNCVDFAWTAMRTLQWDGQPSAIIRLGFEDGTGHAILTLPTSDKGWKFIEPQTNTVVYPILGQTYMGKIIVNMTVLTATWTPFTMFEQDPSFGLQGWEDEESK